MASIAVVDLVPKVYTRYTTVLAHLPETATLPTQGALGNTAIMCKSLALKHDLFVQQDAAFVLAIALHQTYDTSQIAAAQTVAKQRAQSRVQNRTLISNDNAVAETLFATRPYLRPTTLAKQCQLRYGVGTLEVWETHACRPTQMHLVRETPCILTGALVNLGIIYKDTHTLGLHCVQVRFRACEAACFDAHSALCHIFVTSPVVNNALAVTSTLTELAINSIEHTVFLRINVNLQFAVAEDADVTLPQPTGGLMLMLIHTTATNDCGDYRIIGHTYLQPTIRTMRESADIVFAHHIPVAIFDYMNEFSVDDRMTHIKLLWCYSGDAIYKSRVLNWSSDQVTQLITQYDQARTVFIS